MNAGRTRRDCAPRVKGGRIALSPVSFEQRSYSRKRVFSFPGRAICPESPGMSFPRGAERNSISELNASSVPLPAHSSLLPNPYPPHHSFRTVRFHLCTRDRRVSFNTILLLLFPLLFFILPTVVVNVFSSGIVSGAAPAKPASIELRQGSQLMTPRVFATVAACARARARLFSARARG